MEMLGLGGNKAQKERDSKREIFNEMILHVASHLVRG